jgi:hypothetical protein
MQTLNVTTGGSGEAAPDPDQLAQQLEVVRDKVCRDAREIVEVLRVDLPAFIVRQLKERYVGGDGFQLDPEKLKELKADAKAAGERAVAEIIPALESWDIWLDGVDGLPSSAEERKSLDRNPAVSEKVQGIGVELHKLYEGYGFPAGPDGYDVTYRLPSWFIAGRLAISLVESYWRGVEEHSRLEHEIASIREQQERSQRASDWDAA